MFVVLMATYKDRYITNAGNLPWDLFYHHLTSKSVLRALFLQSRSKDFPMYGIFQ